MKVKNMGSLKSRVRRQQVKCKTHLERLCRIGANRPGAQGGKELIRTLAGKTAQAADSLFHLAGMAGVVVGEGLQKTFGRTASHLAQQGHSVLGRLEEARTQYLLSARKEKRSRVPACAFLATATIMLFSATYFGIGVEVWLDGQSLGFVSSKEDMEKIIDKVEERTGGYLGHPYTLSADLTYSLGYMQPDRLLDETEAEEALFAQVEEVSTQYVLSVDGQVIGVNPSKTALELLKQRMLSAQVGQDENAQAEFVQDVTIEQMTVPTSAVDSIDEIELALSGEKSGTKVYSVQQGDTLSQIAENYGMTLEQVQGLNPHIDPARIHVGEEITLQNSEPLLSVKKTTTVEYTQEIAYESEVQYSDELYENESKIVTEGQNGVAQVVANVVSIDGVEQERTIQSWEVVQQPQNEVKVVGTKEKPTTSSKGYFIQPFRGILTSPYGYRSRGFHTGVDWAGTKGSPVVAADGGTVIQAGWNGGYGYCVIIDHGNGLQTLYAHNSALLVRVGEKVAQGQQIAKLGSTGNSTGPHCHWEVRVGGSPVNPMPYLS